MPEIEKTSKLQNAWNRSKGKIAIVGIVTTVAITAIALRAGKQFNTFLDAEGLTEKYYYDPSETENL